MRILLIWLFVFPSMLMSADGHGLSIFRWSTQRYRDTIFNPGNRSIEALGLTEMVQGRFSQYAEFRYDFLGVEWLAAGRVLSQFDGRVWHDDWKIQELYFQHDLNDRWHLMAGRSILRWGTGYAFNPTDVVAPSKSLSDPENNERLASGYDLVKLEYFTQDASLAFVFLGRLDFRTEFRLQDHQFAFRYYQRVGHLDVSAIFHARVEAPCIWGLNGAYVLGDRLEFHTEVSMQRGRTGEYHRALFERDTLYADRPFTASGNDENLNFQFLLGFQYTFPGQILWVSEFFHRDQGLSTEEWERMIDHVRYLHGFWGSPLETAAEGNLLWTLELFSENGTMRNYWMNHLQIPITNRIDFRGALLFNISDRSAVLIPEISFQPENGFTFYVRSFNFLGDPETEFGSLFQSLFIEGGCRIRL